MRDETVNLLRALDRAVANARSATAGPTGKQRAEDRDALFVEMAERSTRNHGAITDPRALALLWDVLVGITTGTLRHRQAHWITIVEPARPDADPASCGTYRCVAGWLVNVAHHGEPSNEWALPPIIVAGGHYRVTSLASEKLPDGRSVDIETEAIRLLFGEQAADDYDTLDEDEPDRLRVRTWANALFRGNNSLADCWDAARELTGGALRVPAELVDLVTRSAPTGIGGLG